MTTSSYLKIFFRPFWSVQSHDYQDVKRSISVSREKFLVEDYRLWVFLSQSSHHIREFLKDIFGQLNIHYIKENFKI